MNSFFGKNMNFCLLFEEMLFENIFPETLSLFSMGIKRNILFECCAITQCVFYMQVIAQAFNIFCAINKCGLNSLFGVNFARFYF